MLILFVVAIPHNISIVFEQDSRFWIALLYLGILGQSVATTIFFIASGRLGSARASSFMFLVPLFALIVSNIILDEVIQAHILIGGLISLVSVYLVNNKKTKTWLSGRYFTLVQLVHSLHKSISVQRWGKFMYLCLLYPDKSFKLRITIFVKLLLFVHIIPAQIIYPVA